MGIRTDMKNNIKAYNLKNVYSADLQEIENIPAIIKAIEKFGMEQMDYLPPIMLRNTKFLYEFLLKHPVYAKELLKNEVYDVSKVEQFEYSFRATSSKYLAHLLYMNNPSIYEFLPKEYAYFIREFERGEKSLKYTLMDEEYEFLPVIKTSGNERYRDIVISKLDQLRPDVAELYLTREKLNKIHELASEDFS